MEIHQPPSQDVCKTLDVAARYNEVRRLTQQFIGFAGEGDGWSQGVANWGHIMGDAGYYSYLL